MSQKIRYDEKFNSRRILKIRSWDKTEDSESVNYIPDSQLPEAISRVGFCLDQVQGWEDYTDQFEKFFNKSPKVVVHVYGFEDLILLESFDYFNHLMDKFIETQQVHGQ